MKIIPKLTLGLGLIIFLIVHSGTAFAATKQQGILVEPQYSTDFSSANFKQSMNNAASDGVNMVTLVIPLRQDNIYSNYIYNANNTPTDQSLIDGINYIHSRGMQVALSIHDDSNDGQWRANINPSNRSIWFTSYGTMLTHYADVAQGNGVEEYVIGTEMSSVTIPNINSANTQGWIVMITGVRSHYSGKVAYDAQHSGYLSDDQSLAFWPYVDIIGISAYYSMGNSGSTVADMKNSWSKVDANELSGLARTYNKPIIFTEVGYMSANNALGDPGAAYGNPGSINMSIQANAYQALLEYWSTSSYMAGVSFWGWSTNPNAGGTNDIDYTPQNKPAEQVMKQWFTSGGNTTTPVTPVKPTTYTTSVTSSMAITSKTQTTTSVAVNASQATSNVLVDLEVYDGAGNKVAQSFWDTQNLVSGSNTYQINWTPSTDGTYVVKVGVFSPNWQANLYWTNNTGSLTSTSPVVTPPVVPPVVTPTPPVTTPTPPVVVPPTTPTAPVSSPAAVNIWWPSNGSTVYGVQPFKAAIDGVDPNTYTMYWQVGDGQLNQMATNYTDAPHKETDVDLSSWYWSPTGQYVITFVAKNTSGTVIAQKSATITVSH